MELQTIIKKGKKKMNENGKYPLINRTMQIGNFSAFASRPNVINSFIKNIL